MTVPVQDTVRTLSHEGHPIVWSQVVDLAVDDTLPAMISFCCTGIVAIKNKRLNDELGEKLMGLVEKGMSKLVRASLLRCVVRLC